MDEHGLIVNGIAQALLIASVTGSVVVGEIITRRWRKKVRRLLRGWRRR